MSREGWDTRRLCKDWFDDKPSSPDCSNSELIWVFTVMSEAPSLHSMCQSFQELVIALLVYVTTAQSCIRKEGDPVSSLGTKVA